VAGASQRPPSPRLYVDALSFYKKKGSVSTADGQRNCSVPKSTRSGVQGSQPRKKGGIVHSCGGEGKAGT